MDLRFSTAEEAFRREVRDFLETSLARPEFEALRGRGGPGDEHACFEPRQAWERHLGAAGYIGLGWPRAYGGRDATLVEQVIFHEEYARARAPGRIGHIGEMLLAPTLLHFGSEAQKQRFLPGIRTGDALWCQGYSEPDAGSDLANVHTRAVREGDEWVVTGQKTWTSHGQWADYAFVLCRTNVEAPRHAALSYLLVLAVGGGGTSDGGGPGGAGFFGGGAGGKSTGSGGVAAAAVRAGSTSVRSTPTRT